MTLQIAFTGLWTTTLADSNTHFTLSEANEAFNRLAATALPDWEWQHIHGRFTILIGGREVPHLGFWGPDDVCLNDWLPVLTTLVKTLSDSLNGEYTWDEGEQGQPAFQWVRDGDEVRFSIVKSSSISGADADPEWQGIPFLFSDLLEEVSRFQADLRREIEQQAPCMVEEWWAYVLSTPL